MRTIPEKIIKMLSIEKKHLEIMFSIFTAESEAIVAFNLDVMKRVNEKKIYTMNRSRTIRDMKENLLFDISEKLLGERKPIKIEFALGLIKKEETRREILDLIGDIDNLVSSVCRLAEKNQKLINHALATIEGTVKSVAGTFKKNRGYNEFGKESPSVMTGAILAGRM